VQAALGRLDKFHQFADVGRAIELRADLFEGLRSVELRAQQQAKRAFDRIEAFAIEAAAVRARPCLRHSNGSRAR